jgi:S1-C subfamily serine protease
MQPVRLPENLKGALGTGQDSGIIIVSVEPGAPGDAAGVLVGDILVQLGDKAVGDPRDVQSLLDPESVGKGLHARVLRGGTPQDLTITVGERPTRGG